ncbi:hypothetical protein JWG45_21895 [Leptospira sp. 201903070]|uniref:Right-handed parallel beta-helix repeat-containing protein n=1 Tax=Leptospira ainlahdjerensis TaxID=2810033 RepID=A0ABS2UHV5_9LEPT|nr:hypothetical protein [Leptospira ainlahdjerensis]MBM9579804.1 hypothetical protein [Leptospira ainlahdjerensis]
MKQHSNSKHPLISFLFLILICLLLVACVPKPDGSSFIDTAVFSNYLTNAQTPIQLRVRVKGLANGASFTISDQDSENLSITGNGDFEFLKKKSKYSEFTISILSQPVTTPSQTCVITNPTGILSPDSNLVEINCGTKFFALNLNVFGIASSATGTLSVRNGAVDTLNLTTDGTYSFSAQVPDLGSYSAAILSNPNKHNCILEPVPAAAGTVNGAPVTLNVNCLSLIDSLPVDQTVIGPNDNLIFTFSKPVTPMSCNFVAPPATCLADLSAAALVPVAANYSGNRLTISPNPNWNNGLRQCLQLAGCTEAGTNRPFNLPRPTSYAVTNQIKYVSAGGAVAGACSTVATACASIQYAISQCNVLSPCFVLVSQGVYSIATIPDRIMLIDRLQLLGGFRPDFQFRDTTAFQTTIRDDVAGGVCGANDPTSCTPIAGGALALTSDILIQGFTIITNSNNQVSTGIWLNNINTGASSLSIDGNIILGSNSATPYALMLTRSGVYASSVSPSFVVSGNYILGGSGNSMSVGLRLLNGTQGLVLNNSISAGSHLNLNDGLDSSIGITVNNAVNNTTQSLVIANNIINAFHVNGTPPVTATTSSGIQALSINSPNFYVLHNTIYGGSGTTRSYGIHHQSTGPLNVNVVNNQFSTNPTATNRICMNYDVNSVNAGSDIRGNNFLGCNIPVQTFPGGTFRLCGPEPANLRESNFCITLLTNLAARNFSHDPLFPTPTGNLDVFLLNSNSRCNSVYGGVDPGYPFPLSQIYQRDIRGATRTANVLPAPVPTGSFGYSIGAFEYNGSCTP